VDPGDRISGLFPRLILAAVFDMMRNKVALLDTGRTPRERSDAAIASTRLRWINAARRIQAAWRESRDIRPLAYMAARTLDEKDVPAWARDVWAWALQEHGPRWRRARGKKEPGPR
jgi:hypothetical protein